jgi:hypothetical protein
LIEIRGLFLSVGEPLGGALDGLAEMRLSGCLTDELAIEGAPGAQAVGIEFVEVVRELHAEIVEVQRSVGAEADRAGARGDASLTHPSENLLGRGSGAARRWCHGGDTKHFEGRGAPHPLSKNAHGMGRGGSPPIR